MKPTQISEAIHDCLDTYIPAFLWGPPGVGKSEIVAQTVKERGYELRDVRLSQMDMTDIKGFPAPDTKRGVMHWLPPNFLPDPKSKTEGVLFLDELNTAPQAIQASCYQLILNRCVGDYRLPDGWRMLAAGNREGDRAIVHRMSSALASRMLHLDFEINPADWRAYALQQNIETVILAYINFRKENLYRFDPKSTDPAYPCPRTWFMVDRIEKQRRGRHREVTLGLITGLIGNATACDYQAFVDAATDLPDIDDVLKSPDKTILPTSAAAQHAVVSMLSRETTGPRFSKFLQYIERMSKEMQIVFIIDVLKLPCAAEVKASSEYTMWCMKNQDVFMGA